MRPIAGHAATANPDRPRGHNQRLLDKPRRVTSFTGPHAGAERRAALASARMRFDQPDAAPSDKLNRLLWHNAKGWQTPYPAVRRALFFPMSLDIADEDREERDR